MNDPSRPLCSKCNKNLARKGRKLCTACTGKGRAVGRLAYRGHKKDHCEVCLFIPAHPCQLDVDHKDGDKSNTDPSNFITICANCHRLKTCEAGEATNVKHRRK